MVTNKFVIKILDKDSLTFWKYNHYGEMLTPICRGVGAS